MSSVVLQFTTTTRPDETIALAHAVGRRLRTGDLLVLTGDLGAGKTHFAKGIATGLGVTEPVTSPTFALHQQYEGHQVFHHLDVYRLEDLAETLDLDLPELLENGVTVIEWGDSITDVLPADRLTVRLEMTDIDDERTLRFEADQAHEDRWRELVHGAVVEVTA